MLFFVSQSCFVGHYGFLVLYCSVLVTCLLFYYVIVCSCHIICVLLSKDSRVIGLPLERTLSHYSTEDTVSYKKLQYTVNVTNCLENGRKHSNISVHAQKQNSQLA